MGADLPPKKGGAPSFIVWAVKDPDDGNLDRIQIIKGWTKNGQIFEKVYDVVWSGERKPDPATGKLPPVGDTVDLKNASYTNTIGATELMKVWKDPDFHPGAECLLLCPRDSDSDPTLVDLRRQEARRAAAELCFADSAGARVDLADLVHADARKKRARASKVASPSPRSPSPAPWRSTTPS